MTWIYKKWSVKAWNWKKNYTKIFKIRQNSNKENDGWNWNKK